MTFSLELEEPTDTKPDLITIRSLFFPREYTEKAAELNENVKEGTYVDHSIELRSRDFRPTIPQVQLTIYDEDGDKVGISEIESVTPYMLLVQSRFYRRTIKFAHPLPYPIFTSENTADGSWIRLMSNYTVETDTSFPNSLVKINPADPSGGIKEIERVSNKMTIPLRAWFSRPEGEENYQVALENYVNRMTSLLAVEVGLY